MIRCRGFLQTRGERPFRLIAAWCTHDDYKHMVHNAWNRYANDVLTSLDNVKEETLVFNKEVLESIFCCKERALGKDQRPREVLGER